MCGDGNGGVRLPCGDQTPACRRFRFTLAKHEMVVMVNCILTMMVLPLNGNADGNTGA